MRSFTSIVFGGVDHIRIYTIWEALSNILELKGYYGGGEEWRAGEMLYGDTADDEVHRGEGGGGWVCCECSGAELGDIHNYTHFIIEENHCQDATNAEDLQNLHPARHPTHNPNLVQPQILHRTPHPEYLQSQIHHQLTAPC